MKAALARRTPRLAASVFSAERLRLKANMFVLRLLGGPADLEPETGLGITSFSRGRGGRPVQCGTGDGGPDREEREEREERVLEDEDDLASALKNSWLSLLSWLSRLLFSSSLLQFSPITASFSPVRRSIPLTAMNV